jgi:hypothetical protein
MYTISSFHRSLSQGLAEGAERNIDAAETASLITFGINLSKGEQRDIVRGSIG